VGTHGRSFWILDDITPLRQLAAKVAAAEAHLFRPQVAYRVRRSLATDTPLPPEEPAGKNPPDGAIINYYLKAKAPGPVTLEVFDDAGKLVRRYSSADKPEPVEEQTLAIPTYWIRPPQVLSAAAGAHRFVWDLHYPPPEGVRRSYPISAIYRDTPSAPLGPAVLPGQYTVKLTVGGRSHVQPLTVKMDPRVKTPPAGLAQQFKLSMQCYEGIRRAQEALQQVRKLRTQLQQRRQRLKKGPLAEALGKLDEKAAALEGEAGGRRAGMRPRPQGTRQPSLTGISAELSLLLRILQGADATPTTQAVAACRAVEEALPNLLERWDELKGKEVKALNEQLRKADLKRN
jgi:hypothetical protein